MSANGQLRADELVKVQEGDPPIFLAKPAGEHWFAMKAAYEKEHRTAKAGDRLLEVARPAGGYRNLFTQQDMHDRPWLYGLSAYSTVPLAPTGYSTHGDGLRVDVANASTDGVRKRWLLANAEKFGFAREFGDADPNHYRLTSTAGIGIPIRVETEEIMFVRIDKGNWAYRDDGVWVTGITQTPADVLTKALGRTAEAVTADEFARLQALLPDRVAAGTVPPPAVDTAAISQSIIDALTLKIPTPAQIATAVNTDAARRLAE